MMEPKKYHDKTMEEIYSEYPEKQLDGYVCNLRDYLKLEQSLVEANKQIEGLKNELEDNRQGLIGIIKKLRAKELLQTKGK